MIAPRVSVIIPTHNRSELLTLTLRTALWQKDVVLEVIVVDDGSQDATPSMLQRLADNRVRVVRHQEPLGVSRARNSGLSVARGDWVAFLDDDDLWAPQKLALQVKAAEQSGRPWAYAGAVKIDEGQRIIGGAPPPLPEPLAERLPRWNLVPGGCSGVIALRNELNHTGGFDPELVNLADWDLWIRLGARSLPARVAEPLVAYRLHTAQASLDVDLILREVAAVERRYGTAVDRGAIHHYLAHRSLRSGSRRKALSHFARAASGGQLRPVAVDVGRLLGARLARYIPATHGRRPDRFGEWRAPAEAWLSELREVAP